MNTTQAESWCQKINAHLAVEGNVVQVTTAMKSTLYSAKHCEWFSIDGSGHLIVRQGKRTVSLGLDTRPYVAIRMGRVVTK